METITMHSEDEVVYAALPVVSELTQQKSKSEKITCSADAAREIRKMIPKYAGDKMAYQEVFIAAALDNANRISKVEIVSVGTVNECQINPADVFRMLINEPGCARWMCFHNHPSGNVTPSTSDCALTRRLVECSDLMGLKLLDHIILGEGYYSFRDTGLIM